jgi:hypothetical protein
MKCFELNISVSNAPINGGAGRFVGVGNNRVLDLTHGRLAGEVLTFRNVARFSKDAS